MTRQQIHKSKEQVFWSIFEAVIQLEVTKGTGRWKVTDLSRLSKVSRPLIYYYFGKSKNDILQTAVNFLGEEYFGISDERMKLWDEGRIVETILVSRNLCQKSPYGLVFYMTRRNFQNEVGERIREYEARYRKKLSEFFPNIGEGGIDGMAGVLFGLVTFPDITDEGVRKAVKVIVEDLNYYQTRGRC